jgi:hypothetical protein
MKKRVQTEQLLAVLLALAVSPMTPARGAPPETWSVRPDGPAATTIPANASEPAVTSANSYSIKPNLAGAFDKGFTWVVAPTRPSPFLLVHALEGWQLWNLHLGAKVRSGPEKITLSGPALSPDGQYVAGLRYGSMQNPDAVEVWSLATKKTVACIETAPGRKLSKVLGFAGSDRVLSFYWGANNEPVISVQDLAASTETAQILPQHGDTSRPMISPGGAYVVVPIADELVFFDTHTGARSGSLPLTKATILGTTMDTFTYVAMAFSPDSKEAALLYMGNQFGDTVARLVLFDLTTGRSTREFGLELKRIVPDIIAPSVRFEYLPDGSGWIIGDTVVAASVGKAVHKFAPPNEMSARAVFSRMATAEQLFQIVKDPAQKLTFRNLQIPAGVLARAVTVIKDGGKLEDAGLPPLTQVDAKSAVVLSWGAKVAPWAVKPAATAAPTWRGKSETMPLRATPPEKDPRIAALPDDARALVFTSRAANSVLIEHATREHVVRDMPEGQGVTWVERYDLARGTVQTETRLPGLMHLLDASPTGNTLVLRTGLELDRLDLMVADQHSYKPLVAFRPYAAESVDRLPQGINKKAVVRIDAAAIIDDAHVLTMSGAGTVMCWELPSGKALWRAAAGRDWRQKSLALSPDRRLGAADSPAGVIVFDALTGEAPNMLSVNSEDYRVESLGFSPDGRQLGTLMDRGDYFCLQVYDLARGTMTADIPLPRANSWKNTVQFTSAGYVLAGMNLVSLERKAVVWQFRGLEGTMSVLPTGAVPLQEGAWFLAWPEAHRPAALLHLALPQDGLEKSLPKLAPDDLYIWHPGMKLSLNMNVVGDEKFRQGEITRWQQALQARGFEVVDGAPNVLTVNTFLVSGQPVQYTVSGSSEKFTATPQTTSWSIQLNVAGKELWKRALPAPTGVSGPLVRVLTVQPGETAQHAADRENTPAAQAAPFLLPPAYILKERSIETSKISPKGLE